ncbi:hypothetical protein BDV19DRAFT_389897 [Aspergillus venezuelensis]
MSTDDTDMELFSDISASNKGPDNSSASGDGKQPCELLPSTASSVASPGIATAPTDSESHIEHNTTETLSNNLSSSSSPTSPGVVTGPTDSESHTEHNTPETLSNEPSSSSSSQVEKGTQTAELIDPKDTFNDLRKLLHFPYTHTVPENEHHRFGAPLRTEL